MLTITDMHGNVLPVVTLDFETYYEAHRGAEYTLSKLTTTTYVRDSRFKAHGCAIWLPDEDEPRWITHCDLPYVFGEINWKKVAVLCHNTAFDGFILSQRYGHVPAYYLDTLSMSRGERGAHVSHSLDSLAQALKLGSKLKGELEKTAGVRDLPYTVERDLVPYALQDVRLTRKAFETFMEANYPEQELHVIDITVRCFCDPKLLVDHDLCRLERDSEAANKSLLVQQAGVPVGQLMSNPQFADLLRERGVDPPRKESVRTGEMTYAFAKNDLAFQALAANPAVSDLVRARLAVKSTIGETRAQRLIEHSKPRLPVLLHYCGAHTHRWSAGDKINLQNLPSGRKPGQSDRLRRSILAPRKYVLVVVDSSQIEARVLAWAAKQEALLSQFANDEDPYSVFASKLYGRPVSKHDPDTKTERAMGKCAILGLGYGMGKAKFALTVRAGMTGPPIDISDTMAAETVMLYRTMYKEVPQLWYRLEEIMGRMYFDLETHFGPWFFQSDKVWMPNGLAIHYPHFRGDYDGERIGNFRFTTRKNGDVNMYGGRMAENLIQSTARTIVAQQAIEIAKRYRIVNLVHDEVIFLARKNEAEEALAYGLHCLRTPPEWCSDLPLDAEGGFDTCYSK